MKIRIPWKLLLVLLGVSGSLAITYLAGQIVFPEEYSPKLAEIVVAPEESNREVSDMVLYRGGKAIYLEKGRKYKIRYRTGSTNPRPLTPEEARRLSELREIAQRFALQEYSLRERQRLCEELRMLEELPSLKATIEEIVWMGSRWSIQPPDSRATLIDLTALDKNAH